jgi:hypothetical protein
MVFLRNGVQVASGERHPGLHEFDKGFTHDLLRVRHTGTVSGGVP